MAASFPERDLTAVKSRSGNVGRILRRVAGIFRAVRKRLRFIALKSLEKGSGREKEAFSMENSALLMLLQRGIPSGSLKDKEVDF